MNFDLKLGKAASVLFLALAMAGCGGGGSTTTMPEPPPPTPYEQAVAGIAAATTAAAAQAAYDAVKNDVTAAEGARLQAAVDARIAALAMMDRAAAQKTALMTAAGNIDTSDLSTQAAIDAAEAAIAALEAALAAATDVSDADKAMYQGQVTAAETAVATAQSALDHAAQMAVLSSAVTALQAIDLSDLSTQAKIDAAQAAVDALRAALAAATELSAAEKTAAMTELATANRTVMAAQGSLDIAGQKMALSTAVDDLGAIDLDALMTQAQIDAADAAILALDLALAAATDLTDAEKLDATVNVTLAKRKVASAKETLATNIGNQRDALTMAGMALGAIDLEDLSDQTKIDAAQTAIGALEAALNGATHLSDAEKEAYQTQLTTATETVRMAQTGMDREGRMMAQRTDITNAVKMATTAVNGVQNDSTDTEVGAADTAIAALEAAIEGAVDLPAGDADVASAQGTLAALKVQLAGAKTARTEYLADKTKMDNEEMAKAGKAMRAALAGPTGDGTDNALANLDLTTHPTLTATTLTINAAAGAGSLADAAAHADVALRTGDPAGSLDGWAGTDYALTTGAGATKVTNEARVYINQGPGTSQPFTGTDGKYTALILDNAADDNDPTNGHVLLGQAAADPIPGTPDTLAASEMGFTHSGTRDHAASRNSDSIVYFAGTYDGAPGTFRCVYTEAAPCTSSNDGKGTVSDLGGTWHFKPNGGAMVKVPDPNYLYYGWWVSKDNDGAPTAASAFTGTMGTVADSVALDGTAAGGAIGLAGTATYTGHAVGKFGVSNPIDGSGDGGHFTAEATLTAKFGTNDAPNNGGISGMLDNFMANDKSVPWSVELHRAVWGSDDNTFATPASDDTATEANETLGTTWSIDGVSGGRSGTWSGQMYDELPGDTNDDTPGDGSNVPTTVTGKFYSEFSSIGRMVGAFGADNQ